MQTLAARTRKHHENEKVRKAIAKNDDKGAENRASEMRGRAFWKVGSRGSEKTAKQKEKEN
jgi:hypothetical protein